MAFLCDNTTSSMTSQHLRALTRLKVAYLIQSHFKVLSPPGGLKDRGGCNEIQSTL